MRETEEKEKKRLEKNRKIATTERVNKRAERLKPDCWKKLIKNGQKLGEQTEIRETGKQGLELEKRENGKGNHKRTKRSQGERPRKFELVDGSFQELGASKWRTW